MINCKNPQAFLMFLNRPFRSVRSVEVAVEVDLNGVNVRKPQAVSMFSRRCLEFVEVR